MNKKLRIFTAFTLLPFGIASAQVGIGTITPDASAALDVHSTTKGFLLPALSTSQRDLIVTPSTGLLIYNQVTGAMEMNTGTPALPIWQGLKGRADSTITSITSTGDLTTSSTSFVAIPGMTLSPQSGTYLVMFNGQYGLTASAPVSTAQGVIDLQAVYNQILAIPTTNPTHAATFGGGETLSPGVYSLPAAASLAGVLTLDGGGDTNAVFIFRSGGAFSTGASSSVVLTNGTKSNNIFWVSEGALSLAASTIMKGTLIGHNAAVSAGSGVNLDGRMLSTTGAISFGPGTAAVPTKPSYINLGVLSSFVMFSTAGAISNTPPSNITGDVGTNVGAINGFGSLNGNVYSPGATAAPINNTIATFGIYQNGVLIANSTRTSDINTSVMALQAIATITTGQPIDIRWKVDAGPLTLGNRILTLVNIH